MGELTATDALYLSRAFELAERGRGGTEPNPRVGCVLVAGDRVIGEGWHRRAGEAHAEVRALEAVRSADRPAIRGCTAYVSLEPCSHHGRTPPCADRLAAEGVGRVVVGRMDCDPRVNGRGCARLEAAGIEVVVAPAASAVGRTIADQLRRFETVRTAGRPYVVLKWAVTADGFVDHREPGTALPGSGGSPISAPHTRLLSHAWRTWEDAILVGGLTADIDVPQLDARAVAGRQPLPIVLGLALPADHPLSGRALLLDPGTDLAAALRYLTADHGITSILVEGGPSTHRRFLAAGVWDEIRVITSPDAVGKGLRAAGLPDEARLVAGPSSIAPFTRWGRDTLRTYVRTAPHSGSV